MPQTQALNEIGLTRPCCRRMILTHIDLSTRMLKLQAMENKNLCTMNLAFGGDDFGDDSGDDA